MASSSHPWHNKLKNNKKHLLVICSIATFAGLLFGLDTGIMSGALPFIQREFALNNLESGRVVGALMFGGAFGALMAGPLSWRIGRKFVMLLAAILFFAGALLCAMASALFGLLLGRVVLGLAIGFTSFAAPLYLAEIAGEKSRGSVISYYQMLITLGILIAFIIDTSFSETGAWRMMLGITALPALVFCVGLLFIPKSPRWLVAKNRHQEAEAVLGTIRSSHEEIAQELANIQQNLTIKQNGPRLFKENSNFRRSVALGALLQIMQQLTGINIILYYAPKIIELAGFSSTKHQMWATITIGLINVLFTFVAIKIIDNWGRRPTLITGFSVMGAAMALLSLMLYLDSSNILVRYFSIFVILAFIAGFAMSAGPLIWTLCSEIQPLNGRDFGIMISTSANWFSNMVISAVFLTILDYLTAPVTFFLLALLNFIFIFITYKLIPETKNISLEKIEQNLMAGKKLRDIGQKLS